MQSPSVASWRSSDYDSFRTGLTYQEVYAILRSEQERGLRRHVTRHTVLGKWHEIKLSMYSDLLEHHKRCLSDCTDSLARYEHLIAYELSSSFVPF